MRRRQRTHHIIDAPGILSSPKLRLNAALICDQVLEDKDGTVSVVRIADRLTIDVVGQLPDTDEPVIRIPSTLFLVFKRETEEPSDHRVQVTITSPSGVESLGGESLFSIGRGPGEGTDLVLRFEFPVTRLGLYWVNVSADSQLLARVPIEVVRK
jgi:hypothetical protein